MSVNIIAKFYEVTREFSRFNDEKLHRIAKEMGLDDEEAADRIARHLLITFHSKTNFFNREAPFALNSPILQKKFATLSRLYDQVANGFFRGQDLQELPLVKAYFEGNKSKTKRELIDRIRQEAMLVHEYLMTFPDWYKLQRGPTHSKAEQLYTFMRIEEKLRPLHNISKLTHFFYKHIALFEGNIPFTWADLADRWAHVFGNPVLIEDLKQKLSGSHLINSPPHRRFSGDTLPFQDFVVMQTIEAFEREFEIGLWEKTTIELRECCRNEMFRMDLVFFTGNHRSLAGQEIKDGPAKWWMEAVFLLRAMKQFWHVPSDQNGLLFHYCLKAQQQSFPPTVQFGKNIQPYLQVAIAFARAFLSEKTFEEGVLPLLAVMKEWEIEGKEKQLSQYTYILESPYFFPPDLGYLLKFLKEGGFDWQVSEEKFEALVAYLKNAGAKDRSTRFFFLLFEPWDPGDIEEAKKKAFATPNSTIVLQYLQNVSIVRMMEEILGQPLQKDMSHFLLKDIASRDGQLRKLKEQKEALQAKGDVSLAELFNIMTA